MRVVDSKTRSGVFSCRHHTNLKGVIPKNFNKCDGIELELSWTLRLVVLALHIFIFSIYSHSTSTHTTHTPYVLSYGVAMPVVFTFGGRAPSG